MSAMNLEPQGATNLEPQGVANLETQGAANLETKNLSLGYEQKIVISELNLGFPVGQISSIIGSNGCGKTTLLRSLARLLKPKTGAVLLEGRAIHQLPSKEVARQISVLPQAPFAPESITVEALVQFGRYPYQGFFQQLTSQDQHFVELALQQTRMLELRERRLETLSGGQRQRAWIAMALAQDTPILLLDEPTTYLDIMHQLEVLHLLEELNRMSQKTIVMVLHDLNQASRYSHQLIAMKDGRVLVQDTPVKVLTHQTLQQVFGIRAHLLTDPSSGKPHIIPYELTQE